MGRYRQTEVKNRPVTEHVLVAERVLGRRLPKGAVVHHWDYNGHNNNPDNLLICPSQSYHMMIHLRQRSFEESGNADYRKCPYCKKYDDTKNMFGYKKRKEGFFVYRHPQCQRDAVKRYKDKKNGRLGN